MPQTNARYAMIGIDDSVTVCDCCGKKNLKCTVELAQTDDNGDETSVWFGRDCAARALGWRVKADDIEGRARTATATAILATSKAWERREIGEGWGRLTARIDGSGLAAVTCQHATFTAIEALENAFGGEWRYVGFAVSERVFRKVS